MGHTSDLKTVSDDDLLRRLSEILQRVRRDEADLIAHIAEIDARGLYAREAVSSMFAYRVEVLHLSEPEAGLRIHVARTCRKHPGLLEMLRDGRIHGARNATTSSSTTANPTASAATTHPTTWP